MKSNQTDCKTDILNLLVAGEAFSLGDMNRLLRSKWTQSALKIELARLEHEGAVVKATRTDYVRGTRLKITTYCRPQGE